MNQSEIISVLCDLYKMTGFRMSLHDADFREIAAYPEQQSDFCAYVHGIPGEFEKCVECDSEGATEALRQGKFHIYRCRYGLVEVASPLYSFGILTGFLMMGQVRENTEEEAEKCRGLCREIIPNEEMRRRILSGVPTVAPEMIRHYVHIMTVCAEYLTLSNAMEMRSPGLAVLAKKYMDENFAKKITLPSLCRDLFCAKSTLMNSFRKTYGVTVNEYLSSVRLEEAERLLKNSTAPMAEIAVRCGFGDQSYFSKVFFAKNGISPSEFRRNRPQNPPKKP